MRKIFILFALVFALVTTATATVVTTAVTSARRPGAGDPLVLCACC